jgi:hypothetical protein
MFKHNFFAAFIIGFTVLSLVAHGADDVSINQNYSSTGTAYGSVALKEKQEREKAAQLAVANQMFGADEIPEGAVGHNNQGEWVDKDGTPILFPR